MKKFLALLLAAVMMLSLVACGNDEPVVEDPTDEPSSEVEEPAESRPNRLIYGSTTEISGDIGPGAWWTNNATDKMIRDLINDYSPITYNQGGELIVNPIISGGVESVANEDGTKTFTVKINEGLVFSNGEPITAANYVAYGLIGYSPAAAEAGAKLTADMIVGATEYQNGETVELSGLHLIDEYTYSITISSDYVPYFYELSYASLSPLYIPMYASAPLTVVEGETGAKFEGGELVAAEIDAARWMYADAVSAGPYVIKSVDTGALEAVLEINPNYAGNFEGVKPQIQQLVIVKSDTATQFDALATGAIDVLDSLSDGTEVNTALDMEAQGGYKTVSFERNGYGKIQFQCDFGPTQFQAVRHAIAYLLDRNEFANTFCQGFGSVVHGPYGLAMWMYKDSEELFADEIDTYSYDPAKAVELLEADGWVYDAEGNDYVSGVRYKKVTAEEAGDYALNVTLADGTILMPLHIKWSSSEANPVSELLVTMLSEGQQTADAGMVIEQTVMSFTELLNYMYRDATQGDQYGVPTYGMYNLATNFTPVYDQSFSFSLDPTYVALGYNTNYIFDEELDRLSMDMVYGVDPSDREGYLDLWQQFILKWNELLPEIPLYSNVYYTIYPEWLNDFTESSLWEFNQAVVYASIENAE
ncbi:MAG: ABC transporter substrate-binding protein [Oscillospiraceae bacterium]|nr:ABC transporter substrate-binding protein [Oscillospiraceae bacterium]